MLKFKHPLLMIVVSLFLAAGVIGYLLLQKAADVVPATESVNRLSEIEVVLPEETVKKFEEEVAALTLQIAEKEAAGSYALDLYFLRGNKYQRLGKLALAFDDLTLVTAGDPGNETAWNNLGDIVIDMGDVNAAESYYQKAIEQDPSEVAYNKLYRYYTLYRVEDRDAYIPILLNLALVDNPGNVSFYVKLGRWYVEHGDRDKAIAAYGQAAVLSPDNQAVKEELQQALAL